MIVRSKQVPGTLRLLILAGMLAAATASATAQVATPSSDGFVTPDPAECTIEPRSLESILAISGTPPPDLRTPVSIATPGLQVPAEGDPADPATVAAVTATIHGLVACENAGDQLRRFAFYTDNVLWYFETQQPLPPEQKIAMFGATPVALPPEQVAAVRVGEVRVLSDGAVVAVVERRMTVGTATIVYVLVQDGDRYLIDHAMDEHFEPSGTPPA